MEKEFKIVDEKGRVLIKSKGGRLLVARFVEMDDNIKDIIKEFYTELTGECPSSLEDFFNFKNEEFEFCS